MKKILLIILSLIFCYSCVSRHIKKAESWITPFGKDTYSVAYTGKNFAGTKMIVFKAANNYCQKNGTVFEPVNVNSSHGWRSSSVELIFRCLDKDDPEIKRTEWEQKPDIVIEDRRVP